MAFGSTPTDSNAIPIGCVYVRGTGFKALQGASKIFTDGSSNDSAPVRVEQAGGSLPTYTYALVQSAPYAVPTDLITLQGSATKLIKVTRIFLLGYATAAGVMVYHFVKRTAANSGGTSSSQSAVIVQHDSTDAAATAVISLYTVIPTSVGTGIDIQGGKLPFAVLASPGAMDLSARIDYSARAVEPLTLHGTAQYLAINFAGSTVPSGGVIDCLIEWTEE